MQQESSKSPKCKDLGRRMCQGMGTASAKAKGLDGGKKRIQCCLAEAW